MVKLVRFAFEGRVRLGALLADSVIDFSAVDATIPTCMRAILEGGEEMLAKIKSIVASKPPTIPLAAVQIKAPIGKPEKIVCVGMNYVDHCTEQNFPIPKEPIIFSKFASSITDPGAPIYFPRETEELDFEVELAIVIGKSGRRISAEHAMEHVAGFTVAHDVSARDWQLKKNGGQWLLGKTYDSFSPMGPAIVTKDEIGDPHNLGIRCLLNGEIVQNSNTNQLIFKTEALVEWISKFVTLHPGDFIFTGTPPGVGCFRKPPLWLKVGDVVTCEIDGIGSITNTVTAEP